FVGAFPGLIVAFFTADEGVSALPQIALFMAISVASFALLQTFVKVSAHTITTLYGAIAFSLFYWFAAKIVGLDAAIWGIRAAAIALASACLLRTWRKEKPFLEQPAAPAAIAGAAP